MIRRQAASWLIVGMLAGQVSAFQVVATSGSRIDDVGIVGFEDLQIDGNAIWFRSTSTSVVVGGASFATGDPVPSGLSGTIEEVLAAATAGERAGVLLSATGPDLSYGLFLVEGGAPVPIVTTAPMDPTRLSTFVMNGAGDVAYVARTASTPRLSARPRAGDTSIAIADDRHLLKPRVLAIDAAGAVAWLDSSRRTVGRWDAAHGTRTTSIERPYASGRAPAIALHVPEGLVVAQRTSVQLWSPDDMRTTLLAVGNVVDGIGIKRVYGDVGFLDDGTVTIRVRASRAPARYVCVKGDARTFCADHGVAGAGVAVPVSSASSIFRARRGAVTVRVRPGDDVPGAGALADVERFVVTGSSVTFLGVLADERRVLARRSDRGTTVLAVDGPTTKSRTLALGSLMAARGSTVLAGASVVAEDGTEPDDASGLVLLRRATVEPLLAPRKALGEPQLAVFASGGLVVLTDSPDALVAARGRRLRPIVVAGKGPARKVSTFEAMVASGPSVVVVGTKADGAAALYELRDRQFRRLLTLPEIPSVLAGGVGGEVALVVTPDHGTTFVDQLQTVREGQASTVATVGDSTPLGTLASIDGVALDDRTIVVAASVSGSGPHGALLTLAR
jgi:hypothetical protein